MLMDTTKDNDIEALRRDVARYRWLKKQCEMKSCLGDISLRVEVAGTLRWVTPISRHDIDKMIDTLMHSEMNERLESMADNVITAPPNLNSPTSDVG